MSGQAAPGLLGMRAAWMDSRKVVHEPQLERGSAMLEVAGRNVSYIRDVPMEGEVVGSVGQDGIFFVLVLLSTGRARHVSAGICTFTKGVGPGTLREAPGPVAPKVCRRSQTTGLPWCGKTSAPSSVFVGEITCEPCKKSLKE
jgi:hypothetical protein